MFELPRNNLILQNLAASNGKSKLGTVITSASCGVSVILLTGAVFAYRYYRMHKLKHDVFVDVEGKFYLPFNFCDHFYSLIKHRYGKLN